VKEEAAVKPSMHPDVEFVVSTDGVEQTFRSFDKALTYAFSVGLGAGEVTVDVLIYSEEGAEWYGGDDAVERYQDDPDASVFNRYKLHVADLGLIP
jgi:hypothetical protein